MAVNEEAVSRILSVLSHPLRRAILLNLSEKGELSFTDLMNLLEVDTGKLSFHVRVLTGFIEQTRTGKYAVSKVGENAIRVIRELETWAVEVDSAQKGTRLPIASFMKRTIAFLVDLAIMLGFFIATATVTNLLSFLAIGSPFRPDISNFLLFLMLCWVYFALLEGFAGQTIGKRILGLKVVRTDGKRLFYDHAAVRNIGKAFLLPFDLLIGLGLRDERYIRYFDKFAGTTVIDLRPALNGSHAA